MAGKRVNVGSKNKAKVEAVAEILMDYAHLADAEVVGIEVPSGVGDQPRSRPSRTSSTWRTMAFGFGLFSRPKAVQSTTAIVRLPVSNSVAVAGRRASSLCPPPGAAKRVVVVTIRR